MEARLLLILGLRIRLYNIIDNSYVEKLNIFCRTYKHLLLPRKVSVTPKYAKWFNQRLIKQ